MMHYRFYLLTDDDHIYSASDHELPDDAAAFAAALKLMGDRPIEAWQSTRVVFRLSPAKCRPEAA